MEARNGDPQRCSSGSDAAKIEQGEGEADIEPLMAQGVPGFGVANW